MFSKQKVSSEASWGAREARPWNVLVFSVSFQSARILSNSGDFGDAKTRANEIERLVAILSGNQAISDPADILQKVLRVIPGKSCALTVLCFFQTLQYGTVLCSWAY